MAGTKRTGLGLLAPGESAKSERVELRTAGDADLQAIATWYGEAVAIATGSSAAARPKGPQTLAILVAGRQEPAGVLEFAIGEPSEGSLEVRFIAMERPMRGWGYGSEAVRLLEEISLERPGARRFWAAIRPANGLNVYFWLRLGYRTACPEDGLPVPVDGLLMVYEPPA